MKNILIRDCIVLPMDSERAGKKYFKGSIGVKDGIIAMVTEDAHRVVEFQKECKEDLKIIDGHGRLAMPGLVNIHNHVSMTLMRGYADDLPLMKWLYDYVWPFEYKLNGDDIKLGAELGIAEMLLGGTTTFVDMYWHEIDVAEAVKKSGIRAVLTPTFTDSRWDAFIADSSLVFDKYGAAQEPRISLMVAPHAVYSCSREHLLEAKRMADKYEVGINIHVSETLDEQKTIMEQTGKTPVEYLDELGMLNSKTLIVHGVHLNDSDMDILLEKGCSVAHNPHSNMKISSGIAPVVKMLEKGINVGIGTDGASSNNDLDMWDELRSASFLQKVATYDPLVLPAYKVLEMGTINGAKAIGLDDKIGRLKEGMLADIIILDIEKPHLYPQHDMVANLVYCAKSSDVDTVIINGKVVVEGCRTLNLDSIDLCHAVQNKVKEIVRRR